MYGNFIRNTVKGTSLAAQQSGELGLRRGGQGIVSILGHQALGGG